MKWDEMGLIGLIGKYEHTVDANGRLSIPAKFREYITQYSEGTVVMTTVNKDSCVVAYPLPEWHAITQRATQMEPLPGEAPTNFLLRKDLIKIFFSRAADDALDKQGRILIPSHLREDAGLQKEVVLVGNMSFFEIWNVQRWQEKEAIVFKDPEKMHEAMALLRI